MRDGRDAKSLRTPTVRHDGVFGNRGDDVIDDNGGIDFLGSGIGDDIVNGQGGDDFATGDMPDGLEDSHPNHDTRCGGGGTDGAIWLATLVTLAELLDENTTNRLREVVATPGERLAVTHTMGVGPGVTELQVRRYSCHHYLVRQACLLVLAESGA